MRKLPGASLGRVGLMPAAVSRLVARGVAAGCARAGLAAVAAAVVILAAALLAGQAAHAQAVAPPSGLVSVPGAGATPPAVGSRPVQAVPQTAPRARPAQARAPRPQTPKPARAARVPTDPLSAEAARTINAYRASRGLGAIQPDAALTRAARKQADAMARADKLSHEVAGDFQRRVEAEGLRTVAAAENLGAGYRTLPEAVAGWRASSGHDRNLRMASATRFGIARAQAAGGRYGTYWALILAGEEAGMPPIIGSAVPRPGAPPGEGGLLLPFGLRIGP